MSNHVEGFRNGAWIVRYDSSFPSGSRRETREALRFREAFSKHGGVSDVPGLLCIGLILLPLLGALVSLPRSLRQRFAPAYTLVPLVQFAAVGSLWTTVREGGRLTFAWPWAPELGLHVSVALDGLSWLFAGLISGVGVAVFAYAGSYMRGDPGLPRLYRLLLLFNAAMMGVVLADNLILLLVFWELTSVSSFLLIGFHWQRPAACEGATKAFGLTAIGGLAMLFGMLAVYAEHGTFELSVLLADPPAISTAAGLCFLAGAFTKSAQFPFHIWLPSAMQAPTPVSAYLHAATMVKAGLYLIARLTPLFADDPTWSATVTAAGTVTLVWGGALACKQVDLKALLANSTVSQLGLIVLLLGLQTRTALFAAVLHIVNHAAFKGALFLTAGAVEHETGTRDLRRLGGLRVVMPLTAGAATLAAVSMAGLPPLGGFVSKELFYESVLEADALLTGLAVAGSCLTFVYSFIFLHGTFFGTPHRTPAAPSHDAAAQAHSPPHAAGRAQSPHADEPHGEAAAPGLLLPIVALAGVALAFGLLPGLAEGLVAPAFLAIHGAPLEIHAALWHGPTPALGLSVVTVAAGGGAFLLRGRFLPAVRGWQAAYSFDRLYGDGLETLTTLFKRSRAAYMTGSVTDYVRYVLLALLLGLAAPLWWFFETTPWRFDVAPPAAYEVGLAGLMAVAAVMCCLTHSRVVLVLALSLLGAIIAIFFVLFSAPDLALTQVLVEAVGLVLFLLVLRYFSSIDPRPVGARMRTLNLGVSAGVGLLVVLLLAAAHAGPSLPSAIPAYYLANSAVLAGGQNVVNVVLVDFRGFDTLGEITVFGVAAFGVLAMVELGARGSRQRATVRVSFPSPILQSFARLTLHLMLVFAMYLLLRGHNAPGGGFIAGVLTAVAFTFQMIAFDAAPLSREFFWNPLRIPLRLVCVGLLLAAGTGVASLLLGHPFLTSAIGHYHLPLVGEGEMVTAQAFDIGVYLVVTGTALGIIRTISED